MLRGRGVLDFPLTLEREQVTGDGKRDMLAYMGLGLGLWCIGGFV